MTLRFKQPVWIALAIVGVILSTTRPALADYLWQWQYTCGGFDGCKGGSGSYTSTEIKQGSTLPYYVVTGITGTVEGNKITSLLPPNAFGGNNNNEITASKVPLDVDAGVPVFDTNVPTGIAFLTNGDAATKANVNQLYGELNYNVTKLSQPEFFVSGPNFLILDVIFTAKLVGEVDSQGTSPVPEPSSVALFGTGAVGLAGALRRRMMRVSR